MSLRVASALTAALVAIGAHIPAAATGPGIFVGVPFEEEFVSGFDFPDAVRTSRNLEFAPGHATLLADGFLAYDFNYDPVSGPYGPVDPHMARFWIEVDDPDEAPSELSVEMSADFAYSGSTEGLVQLQFTISEVEVAISYTSSGPGGSITGARQSIPRSPGTIRLGLERADVTGSYPIIEMGGEPHHFFDMTLFPVKAHDVEILGEGFEIYEIVMETYAFVSNSSATWGRLKNRFVPAQ